MTVLDERVMRAIAGWRDDGLVTSFYLDVDGVRYPRRSDIERRVEHLFRVARERAETLGGCAAAELEGDLAAISGWLDVLERESTRGVAVFSCGTRQRFEALPLPLSVYDQIGLSPEPDIAQLCATLATCKPVLVVVVDEQRSRLLRLEGARIDEVDLPPDELPRQVDTDLELGSFSRHHDELLRAHFRRVAGEVASELERRPVSHLVLDGTQPDLAELEAYLPRDCVAQVVARTSLPMRSASAELAGAARRAVDDAEQARHTRLLRDLREHAGTRTAVVTGLAATVGAIADRQVAALVVERAFEADGGRCPRCGRLVAGAGHCPGCDAATRPLQNVVASAVADALLLHVPLEFVGQGELADLGRIAAVVGRRVGEPGWARGNA